VIPGHEKKTGDVPSISDVPEEKRKEMETKRDQWTNVPSACQLRSFAFIPFIACMSAVRDRRRREERGGKGPGARRKERKRRGVRSSGDACEKKAKLRKHLANGDYHTLGLAARRSPLSVPSERDRHRRRRRRRRRCRCSCIAVSARIIAKVTTRLSFSATVLLLDNGAGALAPRSVHENRPR